MLILFDVDATLITTSRTGIAAMGEAGRELFGAGFDEHLVEYAGRLDPLIIVDLLRAHRLEVTDGSIAGFRAAYGRHLVRLLSDPSLARPCPGVMALLARLERIEAVTLGLLTGNYPETGSIKLRAAGIEPDRFAIHVWGSDSPYTPPARDHLPAVGMERFSERTGRRVDPGGVVIVGDTPHDIGCARANGCRSLGVSTGKFGVAELREAGADLAVRDLSDTEGVIEWLLK